MTFEELELAKPLLKALSKKGYVQPTPIQEKAIPAVLEGRDIFGMAQTGTGKTAAFALPILQKLLENKDPNERTPAIKALILAPTRELANQISESFSTYGAFTGLRHTTVYGGVSMHGQIQALRRGVDILIATPGRLMDLGRQGYIKLKKVEYFVLDEADRMLDMGFIDDIRFIITKLPEEKQTLFFSATAPTSIKKLANSILEDPIHVVMPHQIVTQDLVKQSVYYVRRDDKRNLLQHLLKEEKISHALVFTRTKHGADKVVDDLLNMGIRADAIHGNKSQNARDRALRSFKNRQIQILVATDVASRGIDVDKLSHVINFDLPEQAETYIHRIGRTGRAGELGNAFSFCANDERHYLRSINNLTKNEIEIVSSHPFSPNTNSRR